MILENKTKRGNILYLFIYIFFIILDSKVKRKIFELFLKILKKENQEKTIFDYFKIIVLKKGKTSLRRHEPHRASSISTKLAWRDT